MFFSLPLRALTLVVESVQAGQGSDDGQAVPERLSITARVLGQPQHLQTAQRLQMLQLRQTRDRVPSQIELAEVLTRREVLQGADLIHTGHTVMSYDSHHHHHHHQEETQYSPQCEHLDVRDLCEYGDLWREHHTVIPRYSHV